MKALQDMLGSKKALATLIGVLLTVFAPKMGIPPEKIQDIVYLVMAYIVGQGVADFGKGAATLTPPAAPPQPPTVK